MVADFGGKPKKKILLPTVSAFSFEKHDCGWESGSQRSTDDRTVLSFQKEKTEAWILANCTRTVIGFMKNKNYIKSLFKKKSTFMNKYSLGYSLSSGKGRIEVTFAKSPSNA